MSKRQKASSLQREIRGQILSLGQMEGWERGHHLVEQTLAKEFGVSRTPVRNALRLLEQEGVVQLLPNKGFVLLTRLAGEGLQDQVPQNELSKLTECLIQDRAKGLVPRDISETGLAESYDISRAAARRALIELSSQGLAHRLRGHGWRFAESLDSRASVEESYRFRILVECAGLSEPTFKPDMDDVESLIGQHQELMATPPAEIARGRWIELNIAFHAKLAEWSGNRFIAQAVKNQNNLRRLTEYSVFHDLPSPRFNASLGEHLTVLEAIKTGDAELARFHLTRHLQTSLAAALEALE